MALADLHVHSTASDGRLTPSQVVEAAAKAKLTAIALSDHDTVDGIDEAIDAGSMHGVQIVPAVEINTDFGLLELHILGYFIDWKSEKLLNRLKMLRTARLERGRLIVEKLQALNVPITMERVLEIAGTGSIGRPHIARAICETGIVNSLDSAFGRYLVRGAPAYVERTKLTAADAIEVIVEAGGVAGLAHPKKMGREQLVASLVKVGLGAVEVYHPDHPKDVANYYQAIARRQGLIVTGGSDFHGNGNPIGSKTVDFSAVEALKAAAPASNCAE